MATCGLNLANSVPSLNPIITSLSSYVSTLGTSTAVAVKGLNFRSYSTVTFGTTTNIQTVFISSNQINFYVPSTYGIGTYPVQVFCGALPSNTVSFTVENNSGYWVQSGSSGNVVTNTNSGGVVIQNGLDSSSWTTSPSIPGAYLYDASFQSYPISSSIASYATFYYTNNNLPPTGGVLFYIGLAYSGPNLTNNDQFYVIFPGYKLVVYNGTVVTLTVQNLSSYPVSSKPLQSGTNCNLYKYVNNTWILLST